MAEPNITYKITILAMLDKVDFPLSNTQISNFFLDRDYTDYFSVQQNISGLLKSGLIKETTSHNNTQYSITDSGRETLYILQDKINSDILEDLNTFFKKSKMDLKQENSVITDYYKTTQNGYNVRCQIKEKAFPVVDLTLHVSNKVQAEAICANWQKTHMEIYAYLMDTLMQ